MNARDVFLTAADDPGLDLAMLTDDGDTLEMGEHVRVTLKIEHDPDTDVNDFDCYGTLSDAGTFGRGYCNDYGHHTRPDGFTGAARKLWHGNDGPWWWEPPADMRNAPAEDLRRMAWRVAELAAYGFRCIGVVVEEEVESTIFRGMWSWQVVAEAWIRGVDTDDPAYVNDLAREMFADVVEEISDAAPSVGGTMRGEVGA